MRGGKRIYGMRSIQDVFASQRAANSADEDVLQPPTGVLQALNAAVDLKQAGQQKQALNFLEGVAKTHPDNALILRQIVHLYLSLGKFTPAEATLCVQVAEHMVEIAPEDQEGTLLLSQVYVRTRQQSKALSVLNEFAFKANDAETTQLFRGYVAFYQMHYAEAIENIEPYTSRYSVNTAHDIVLAQAYFYSKRYLDAYTLLEKSIALYDENATSHYWFGRTADKVRRVEVAMQAYSKAIQLNPYDVRSYAYLVKRNLGRGRLRAACQLLSDGFRWDAS